MALTRDLDHKMIAGVCAGIGKTAEMDVTVVRIIWSVGTLFSFGLGLILYVLMAIIVPSEQSPPTEPPKT